MATKKTAKKATKKATKKAGNKKVSRRAAVAKAKPKKAARRSAAPSPAAAFQVAAPVVAIPCWQYKKCGREPGGVKIAELGICPAYPNHGRDCWMAAGTFCGGQVQGTYAEKLGNCQKCEFYQQVMSGIV